MPFSVSSGLLFDTASLGLSPTSRADKNWRGVLPEKG